MISALCYGSINPDIVHRLADFPEPGDDIRSADYRLTYGGGGVNPAVALAAWGVATSVAGNTLGDDPLGRWLVDDLAGRGVDVSLVETTPGLQTPHCIVLVGSDGERTIISTGYRTAGWPEVPDDAWIGRSVAMVDAYSAGAGTVVIRRAGLHDVPVVGVDVAGRAAAGLTATVWSRHEHDLADALALSESGPDVVLTAGRDEAKWCRGGEILTSALPPDVVAVDPTGAGDTLAAMVALGIGSGWEPDRTLRMAVAAASMTVGLERGDPIPDLGSITARASGT